MPLPIPPLSLSSTDVTGPVSQEAASRKGDRNFVFTVGRGASGTAGGGSGENPAAGPMRLPSWVGPAILGFVGLFALLMFLPDRK